MAHSREEVHQVSLERERPCMDHEHRLSLLEGKFMLLIAINLAQLTVLLGLVYAVAFKR